MKRIFLVSIALLFVRCDLFDSRPAEPPASSKSDFQPANTIDRLILNLINSFADKNSQNYIACFSDTITGKQFIFSPSSGAISQFPDLAQGWNLQDERFYFENAMSKVTEGASVLLDLSNQSFSQQGSDSAFYSASYTLKIPNEDPNLPDEFKGDLNFKMILNSVWSVYYWQDIKSSDSPSWSELKGRLH